MTREKILIDALQEYIAFLDYHIARVSQIAMIHGYRFKQEEVDKGKELREKIQTAIDEASPSALPENKEDETIKVSVNQLKGMRKDMDMAMRREIFLLDKIKSILSEGEWRQFLDENNFTEVPELIRLKFSLSAASALPNQEETKT